jgi:hypothetical protein
MGYKGIDQRIGELRGEHPKCAAPEKKTAKYCRTRTSPSSCKHFKCVDMRHKPWSTDPVLTHRLLDEMHKALMRNKTLCLVRKSGVWHCWFYPKCELGDAIGHKSRKLGMAVARAWEKWKLNEKEA